MLPWIWCTCLTLATAQELPLGIYMPFTSYSQVHLGVMVAFDLDLQKRFDPEVSSRFGAPIVEIPDLHPQAGLWSTERKHHMN